MLTRTTLVVALLAAGITPATPTAAQTTPAVVGSPGPTLEEARKALEAAVATAKKAGVTLSCAVVDSRGDLIALNRMDNARFITTDIARGKALAAAIFGQPSGSLERMASAPWFQNLNTAAQGRLYPAQGGLPILRNQQTYGAIACSGATGQLDEESAKAGLATF
jgi:glc operon protein GlcG